MLINNAEFNRQSYVIYRIDILTTFITKLNSYNLGVILQAWSHFYIAVRHQLKC